jgi:hypothetical protein
MPFARFENFEACSLEQKRLGHDEESANKICGEIKERAEKGILYKADDITLQLLSKAGEADIIVAGMASWENVDPERDINTVAAQVKGLERFLSQPPEFQSITANHKEFKLAQPLLKYTDSLGKEYFTHVNEKGTFLISKLRNDNMRTTQHFRKAAKEGNLTGYSISGIPLAYEMVKAEDGAPARRIDDIEYWSVTLCEKGVMNPVNPKTTDVKTISKSLVVTHTLNATESLDMNEPSFEDILHKYGFNKCNSTK